MKFNLSARASFSFSFRRETFRLLINLLDFLISKIFNFFIDYSSRGSMKFLEIIFADFLFPSIRSSSNNFFRNNFFFTPEGKNKNTAGSNEGILSRKVQVSDLIERLERG